MSFDKDAYGLLNITDPNESTDIQNFLIRLKALSVKYDLWFDISEHAELMRGSEFTQDTLVYEVSRTSDTARFTFEAFEEIDEDN